MKPWKYSVTLTIFKEGLTHLPKKKIISMLNPVPTGKGIPRQKGITIPFQPTRMMTDYLRISMGTDG